MDEKAEKLEKNGLLAYDIAKQILKVANSYNEAMEIIEKVKENFEWSKIASKPQIRPWPTDKWNNEIKMPQDEA